MAAAVRWVIVIAGATAPLGGIGDNEARHPGRGARLVPFMSIRLGKEVGMY